MSSKSHIKHKYFDHVALIELIWTITPALNLIQIYIREWYKICGILHSSIPIAIQSVS